MPNPSNFTPTEMKKDLIRNFGEKGYESIINYKDKNGNKPYNPKSYEYNKNSDMTPAAQAISKVMTDYTFISANLSGLQRNWSKQADAKQPVYGYYFTKDSSFNYQGMKRCGPNTGNICHTYELPYVFHNFVTKNNDGLQIPAKDVTVSDVAYSEIMSKSWAGFAKDPYNWKEGFGYPPLEYALEGNYVQFKNGTPELINNIVDVANYPIWVEITPAQQVWVELVKFDKIETKKYKDVSF